MGKRILVFYDTKSGSTTEVARCIGDELAKQGAAVDVRRFGEVVDLHSYEAMVAGSPIIDNECMPGLLMFLQRNQDILSTKPVAYFFTSMLLARADAQEKDFPIPLYIDPPLKATSSTDRKHTLSYYVRPVLNEAHRIKPVHIGFFKGKLDFNTLGFLNMMTMRLITTLVKEVKEGDFRDWDAMRSWAKQVYPMLAA